MATSLPGLNPLDISMRCLNYKAYQPRCPSPAQLTRAINSEFRNVDADLLRKVRYDSQARLHTVIRENDHYFYHIWHSVKTLGDTEYDPNVRC